MDIVKFYSSIGTELSSVKNRIRKLSPEGLTHWPTDGEWKESSLRRILRVYVPETIKVGRGFITDGNKCSNQIDILLYSGEYPTIHKDGDLVFINPDAVRGVIEVKSKMKKYGDLEDAFDKLVKISEMIYDEDQKKLVGLFAYHNELRTYGRILNTLQDKSEHEQNKVITHVSLGSSWFFRYWNINPRTHELDYNRWHFYNFNMKRLSHPYFIFNVVSSVSNLQASDYHDMWFPQGEYGKEQSKVDDKPLIDQ